MTHSPAHTVVPLYLSSSHKAEQRRVPHPENHMLGWSTLNPQTTLSSKTLVSTRENHVQILTGFLEVAGFSFVSFYSLLTLLYSFFIGSKLIYATMEMA